MPKPVDVTLPNDTEIVVKRSFDAPAEMVFDFYTKPELVRQWMLGPDGWSMPVCEIDLRVGGGYRYVWRADDDSHEFGATGEYHEIEAPTRIVNTERMDGFDGKSLCTLTLEEAGGKTLMISSMVFDSREARDGAVATGMTDGMAQSFDRMEEAMQAQAA
ncbi:SRPBCC family protein [Pelagibacterium halotolerans]|uniref:SRPBCC family protein n=1 Tax=Pelagibacterium halotolerans TaxID=531813 RepID=UPI00384A7FDC